jgi:hypothetical protein
LPLLSYLKYINNIGISVVHLFNNWPVTFDEVTMVYHTWQDRFIFYGHLYLLLKTGCWYFSLKLSVTSLGTV